MMRRQKPSVTHRDTQPEDGCMHSCLQALRPILPQVFFYRARIYAENRVICGHHWKTDTDAALMLAAGTFATVVSTDGYQEQLKKGSSRVSEAQG